MVCSHLPCEGIVPSLLTWPLMILQSPLRASWNLHTVLNFRKHFSLYARNPFWQTPQTKSQVNTLYYPRNMGKILGPSRASWEIRLLWEGCIHVLPLLNHSVMPSFKWSRQPIKKSPSSILSRKGSRNISAFSIPSFSSNILLFHSKRGRMGHVSDRASTSISPQILQGKLNSSTLFFLYIQDACKSL